MKRLDLAEASPAKFLAVSLSAVTLLILLGLIGMAALFHARPGYAAQTDDTSAIEGLDWTLTLTGPEQPVVKGSSVTYEATLTCSGANGSFSDFDLTVTGLDVPDGETQPTTQDGGYKLVYTGAANTASTANDEAGKAISATASVTISYDDPPGTPQTKDLTATIKIHVVDLTSAGGQLEYFAGGTYKDDIDVGYITNSFYEVTLTNPAGFENEAGLWAYEILDNDDLDDQGKPTFVSSDDEYEFTQMGFTSNGNYIVRFFGDIADDEGAKNTRWDTGEPKDDIDVAAFDITTVQGKLPTQLDSQYSSSFIIATGETPEYFITTNPAGCETELSVRVIDVTDPDNETFVTSSSADNVWNTSGQMDFSYTFNDEGTFEVRFYQDANGNNVIDSPNIPPIGELMDYCTVTVSDTITVNITGHQPGTMGAHGTEVTEANEDDPDNLQVFVNVDDDDDPDGAPDNADTAIAEADDDIVKIVLHAPGAETGSMQLTVPGFVRVFKDANTLLADFTVDLATPGTSDLAELATDGGSVELWLEGTSIDYDAVIRLALFDEDGREIGSDAVHISVFGANIIGHQPGTVANAGEEVAEAAEDDPENLEVAVNFDDDNGNGMEDYFDPMPLDQNDDDFVKLTLKKLPLDAGTWSLRSPTETQSSSMRAHKPCSLTGLLIGSFR